MTSQGQRLTVGRRIAPPRFLAFLALCGGGFAVWHTYAPTGGWQDALAMGFDLGAAVFLLSLLPLLRDHTAARMRADARANDANRGLVLAVTTFLTLVVMAAVTGELAAIRASQPFAMAKLLGTLALIWLFANAVYALHYAHAYYAGDEDGEGTRGGIDFPATRTPDYADFAYFAFTLGMTFQTSDVQITGRAVRRIALLHSLAAFVFNLGVIAFTINALGGIAG